MFCNGLGYVWQNAGGTEIGTMCRIVETRCNDIQRQRWLGAVREMKSLCLYRELENTPEEERCIHDVQGERRKGHSGTQVGNLVIERGERGTDSGRCLLCGEENESHVLLKWIKTERWREQLPNSKWPQHEEVAMREMLTGAKATELRDLGILEYWIKCEWENWLKKV